jgi:ATP-dependent DNA helicase RecG
MPIEELEIDQREIENLLGLEENHFYDLKAKEIKPAKLTRTLSAFANASGGDLYVGIDEIRGNDKKREWRGFTDAEEANGHIQALENFFPLGQHAAYSFLKTSQKPGLVLHVSVNKTPFVAEASNDKPYLRRGAQNIPVTDDQALERLRLDKGVTSFEIRTVDSSLHHITNSETIIRFLLHVVPRAEPEEWLRKQQLIKKEKPTVGGVLLFSKEPQIPLPKRSSIKILRYKTREEEGSRQDLDFDPITIEGNLYNQITEAVDKTEQIVQDQKILTEKGLVPARYPTVTLHEIITNAVLHRDYSLKTDTQVRIFDDRIEIESPGKLPGHVTPENIENEQVSRNAKIVRLMNKFPDPPNKDVGEGFNAALDAMKEVELKPPKVREKENSVWVKIPHDPLASPEDAVMEYLENHDEITNSIARELTGIGSENKVKRVFYGLRDSGLIERVPGKKGSAAAWQKTNTSDSSDSDESSTHPSLFDEDTT